MNDVSVCAYACVRAHFFSCMRGKHSTSNAKRNFEKRKQKCVDDFELETQRIQNQDASFFNEDSEYITAITSAVNFRSMAFDSLMKALVDDGCVGQTKLANALDMRPDQYKEKTGNTLLHLAIIEGISSIMETLIRYMPHALTVIVFHSSRGCSGQPSVSSTECVTKASFEASIQAVHRLADCVVCRLLAGVGVRFR